MAAGIASKYTSCRESREHHVPGSRPGKVEPAPAQHHIVDDQRRPQDHRLDDDPESAQRDRSEQGQDRRPTRRPVDVGPLIGQGRPGRPNRLRLARQDDHGRRHEEASHEGRDHGLDDHGQQQHGQRRPVNGDDDQQELP